MSSRKQVQKSKASSSREEAKKVRGDKLKGAEKQVEGDKLKGAHPGQRVKTKKKKMATWLEKMRNSNMPRRTEKEMQDLETYFHNSLRRDGYKYKEKKPEDEIPARPKEDRLNKEEGFRNHEEAQPKKSESDPSDDERSDKKTARTADFSGVGRPRNNSTIKKATEEKKMMTNI